MLDEIIAYKQEFLFALSSMDGTGSLKGTDDPREFLRLCRLHERRETTPENLVPATQFVLFRPEDQKLLGTYHTGQSGTMSETMSEEES